MKSANRAGAARLPVPWHAGAAEKRAADSPAAVKLYAQAVYQQAVLGRLMPMNKADGITDAERALISPWFDAGARTD